MSITKYDACSCGRQKMVRSDTCRDCFTRWPDRFWAKVQKSDGCWIWTAMIDQDGYGVVSYQGKNQKAHRMAWLIVGNSLPDDLTIDHLCRNRACVNPAHMEPVTSSENVLRGDGMMVRNARKTHCSRGHEFTPENTRIDKKKNGRVCRTCARINEANYRSRRVK